MTEEKLLPLHQAILDNDTDAFRKILDETDDVKSLINEKDEKERNAIFYAARNGRISCFKCILELGASLDFIDPQTGDNLLHVAFAYGGHKLINYLIDECHMDINAVDGHNRTILGVAMLFADIDEACYLVCKGVKNVGDIEHLEVLLKYIPLLVSLKLTLSESICMSNFCGLSLRVFNCVSDIEFAGITKHLSILLSLSFRTNSQFIPKHILSGLDQ